MKAFWGTLAYSQAAQSISSVALPRGICLSTHPTSTQHRGRERWKCHAPSQIRALDLLMTLFCCAITTAPLLFKAAPYWLKPPQPPEFPSEDYLNQKVVNFTDWRVQHGLAVDRFVEWLSKPFSARKRRNCSYRGTSSEILIPGLLEFHLNRANINGWKINILFYGLLLF